MNDPIFHQDNTPLACNLNIQISLFKLFVSQLILIVVSIPCLAAVPIEQLSQLDSLLTPLGAEREGNNEGTIPKWVGNKKESDLIAKKLINERPLFTITSSNVDQYSQYLSTGQKALFSLYPGTFQMPVYPSHRLHNAPQWLYDATRKNGLQTKLIDEGNGITNVWPGHPFPIPKSAIEVLWNHLTAWRGTYIKAQFSEATVQPNGVFSIIINQAEVAMPYYDASRDIITNNVVMTYYLTQTLQPARLAGGALLVYDSLNPRLTPRKAWIYNSGQRRVRRLPALDHDIPNMNSEHIRVVDEVDLFNGAPDRYDWSIVGKREIFIPYNSATLAKNTDNFEQLLTPYHLSPKSTRYELHRVWVLEAKLKSGSHHIYPRRILYLDEDSWIAIIAEQYDRNDNLWRVSLSHTKYYPDMPGVMKVMDAFHDLHKQTHYVQSVVHHKGKDIKFSNELPNKKYFSPASLRRKAKR